MPYEEQEANLISASFKCWCGEKSMEYTSTRAMWRAKMRHLEWHGNAKQREEEEVVLR